jgi:hypothetical protein
LYADLNSLRARAGRLAAAWTDETDPDAADLERFLAECSATLDLELGGHGIITPVDDPNAMVVLGGMAADGALVMAIEATWPGDRPADVGSLLDGARTRWEAALAGIRDGTNAVVSFLVASGEELPVLSSCFWVEEPFYPYGASLLNDMWYPLTRPGAYRGQSY